jgi:hypothetical protein
MRSPIRQSSRGRAAACCSAVAAAALLLPSTGAALQRPNRCGHVQGTVAVSAHKLACAPARSVANAYLNGHRNPDGFRCQKHSVDAAAGWWAKCTRGSAYVQITPE